MASPVWGVVHNGRIVPSSPLPEGAHVEIRLCEPPPEVSPQLQEELNAGQQASADALDLVERWTAEALQQLIKK
jgi:hypothetical protein